MGFEATAPGFSSYVAHNNAASFNAADYRRYNANPYCNFLTTLTRYTAKFAQLKSIRDIYQL